MHCTNINHPQIQDWAKEFNVTPEKIAGVVSLWQEKNNNLDEFPSKLWIENQIKNSNKENEVNFSLKSIEILSSQKADDIFKKGNKNSWSIEKILSELQIPQEQKQLLLSFNTRNREELLTNLLANYSYTVEINTAKEPTINKNIDYETDGAFDENGNFQSENTTFSINGYLYEKDKFKHIPFGYGKIKSEEGYIGNNQWETISEREYEEALERFKNKEGNERPTQHYSNLTVPGGTNYTENEIATPVITPSIKGHASFATDKGIGWFRSDDKENKVVGWKEEDDFLNSETAQYNPITKDDKVIFGHPTIGKSYLKQKGNNDFITLDDDYANEVNSFIDKNRGSETRQEYKGRKPKEYNEFMLNLFDRLKIQAQKEGKRLFVSNTNILKERMSEFDKVITIPKDEFKKRFDARGATYGFEDWKSDIDATVAKVDKSKVISTTGYLSDLLEGNPKTRRILEVQSDLFQKGRDSKVLSKKLEIKKVGDTFISNGEKFTVTNIDTDSELYELITIQDSQGRTATMRRTQLEKRFDERGDNSSDNQFLQLLNKNNNWVTFFTKSIIQDSAKKGYEKVLFPSGNTASKVEGHTTLEEFKKQKEDRIKELENPKGLIEKYSDLDEKSQYFITEEEWLKNKNSKLQERQNEIDQLKQELEQVEGPGGFAALKPIYNFYENTVTNILKKQGYNPVLITDEYGNTWNEIILNEKNKEKIFLNKSKNKVNNSDKYFKDVIQPLIKTLSKKFPNTKVIIISENELPENLKGKNINSYYKNNEVFIVKEKVTPEITIEEFLHPFVNVLKESNEELYKSLLKEAKQLFPELRADIKDNYKGVYDNKNDIDKEFLTQVLSKKVSQKQLTLFKQFKNWLKEILFGKTDNINLEDLDIDMKLGDVISMLSDNYTFNINDYSNGEFYSKSNDITDNLNFFNNLGKQNGIQDKEVLSIPNTWTEEQNKLVTQQYEHIEVSRLQKKTAEKLMSIANDLSSVTEDSYILKNNTILNRASSEIDKDDKFKFDKEDFDESKYENNRIWGNQIDDILRAVVLYRFDENQKENVIKEIQKQQFKRNENSLLSDEVTFKLISEFNKFCQKHSDKIIIPQQFLYNEENKIGDIADIVLIDKYGNVEVVDLKSSVNPINWTGNYFKNYTKVGEDGNEYSNNYNKKFSEDRGSKKERHEAKLSMYIGMMNARGINHNESHPIHILPVHIKRDEYSEEIINDATVERNDFPMNLNKSYLNKVSIDLSHNERVMDSYETEFEQNKNKLILFVKSEIDLQKRINDKTAEYRVKELKEMLQILENNDIANSSKLANYILDLHKTFVSGNFALVKQIKNLVNDIKNGTIEDNDKAISELMKYKEKILFFTPLINELKEFYDDIQEENFNNENNPDSILFKLDELLNTFKTIDTKYYKKFINPLLAEKYSIASSSEKANKQSEKLLQRNKEKLERLKNELNKLPKDNDSLLIKGRIGYLNYRINSLNDTIYKIENKLVITKENILKQLNEGSFEDISFIQKMTLSPQSSSNVFIAGTAKIIDEIFHNIRMKEIEVQEHIHEAFEDFAKYNKNVNRNNVKEFNKDFYETITTGYIENKELKTTQDLALVQQIDITKFNEEKKAFLESIKNIEDSKEYWQKYNDWFLQNTENLSNKDIIVDGYTIRKGIDSIIKEKQDDVKNNIITEAQYNYWYGEAFSKDKNGNRIVNYSTKQGRQLRVPLSDKYTNKKWQDIQDNPEKAKYYNTLLTTYLKAQDKYPQRKSNEHRYILPYINKELLHRVDENGAKNTAKEVVARTFNESKDNEKQQYGESQLKVIPILYNDKIPMEDVSLDLAQSILLFDSASKEFEARTKAEPILKAVQFSLAENKPLKTDSKGRAIITKFAEDLNLPGFDKYVKSSESNIEALFKYYMDNMIYGISRQKQSLNTPFGEMDAHSLVDSMSNVISRTSLGLPFGLFSNVANWLQGEAQTFIEAHSKQFFDTKTYLWAEKEYLSLTKDFIKDFSSPINKTLIGQLLEIYDPFIGEFKDKYGRNISKSKSRILLTSSPAFFLQNLGEHHIQVKTMLAFLKSTKIKDNLGNELSLYDAYEMNENGKIKLKDGVDLSQLGNTTTNNLLPLSIKSKLNSILQQTHGNYSKMTAPMMRKYWYGRVLEFMRRFFMTSVEKRWRQSRYNFEKEDLDEGYNRTFWRLFTTEFKELFNVGFGFATFRDNNLTELEVANLRRNAMDIAFVAVTGLLVMILTAMMKNAGDDDEKERIALFLAPIMRLNAELSAFGQIGDPSKGFAPDIGDIKRNLSTPSVMFGYATKTIQFLEQIPKDVLSLSSTGDIERYSKNSGFYEKGDSKIMAKFLKLFGASPSKMDLTESIKSLQLQQNK